ncbi:MAG: hypothetical protein J0H59_02900 [Comamonadaceae bacterium]|jgi:hypothetical protein|nr:hypothetical protein [Comamonadaceae bacterium]
MHRKTVKSHREQGNVWLILLAVLAAVIGAWQYSEHRSAKARAAAEELRQAVAAADALEAKWQDAAKVAYSTGRIALSGPVATLQTIRREAEQMTPPPCLAQGKAALVASMTHTVDGFLAFMQNTGDAGNSLSMPAFEKAAQAMNEYKAARAACPGNKATPSGQ